MELVDLFEVNRLCSVLTFFALVFWSLSVVGGADVTRATGQPAFAA